MGKNLEQESGRLAVSQKVCLALIVTLKTVEKGRGRLSKECRHKEMTAFRGRKDVWKENVR